MRYKMFGDIIITQYSVGFDSWSYTAWVTKAWVTPAPDFKSRITLETFTLTETGDIEDSVTWLRSLEHQGLQQCYDAQQEPIPFEHHEDRAKGLFVLPSGELRLLPLFMSQIYSDLPLAVLR